MNSTRATFKLRYLAAVTDFSIFSLPTVFGMYYVASQPTLPLAVSSLLLIFILVIFNPLFLYQSVVFTHYIQGTLGKLLTGLRVTAENGEKLSFKRVAFRQTIGYSFSWLIFGLGFWSMIKDPNKQTWHDKAVGSVVIVKQKLWPLALLTIIIFMFLNFFFIKQAVTLFVSGPLLKETQIIINNIQQELEQNNKQQQQPNFLNPPRRNSPQSPARTT